MKKIGFPIAVKPNENRRALLPQDIRRLRHPEQLYFEKGYGDVLGLSDPDYLAAGARVVSRPEVLEQEIICEPKIGDSDYLLRLNGQTLFGWSHAVQNHPLVEAAVQKKLTAYAWGDMFDDGRHVFWRNNEIAGEAAVLHAFTCFGVMPYQTHAALIGRGNVALGALKILNRLGAEVDVYHRANSHSLRRHLQKYDVIVNAVLWDPRQKRHLIDREDLKRMKRGAMIIDVSCDRHGGIATCEPTGIANPVYTVDGILHYAVDHTPTVFYQTASRSISEAVAPYLDELIEDRPGKVLLAAKCIDRGKILDERILRHQRRHLEPGEQ